MAHKLVAMVVVGIAAIASVVVGAALSNKDESPAPSPARKESPPIEELTGNEKEMKMKRNYPKEYEELKRDSYLSSIRFQK